MLTEMATLYPDTAVKMKGGFKNISLRRHMLDEINRVTFEIETLVALIKPPAKVADIGGGINLFVPGLASLGFLTILVDDFRDRWHPELHGALDIHRRFGARIITADILESNFALEEESLDAVTCIHVLEHLGGSPKRLLCTILRALKPNGILFLGVPNCVNLRKRLTVPFGDGKWSQLEEWYEEPIFRGHVRELDVKDLRYIANDLGLDHIKIWGKNWIGYNSRYLWVRGLIPIFDRLIQIRPTLCSDIYLIGNKA